MFTFVLMPNGEFRFRPPGTGRVAEVERLAQHGCGFKTGTGRCEKIGTVTNAGKNRESKGEGALSLEGRAKWTEFPVGRQVHPAC